MTEKKKRKGGWFWLGVALLAIVALFWLILMPTAIANKPGEVAYLIGGLLMLSAIAIPALRA